MLRIDAFDDDYIMWLTDIQRQMKNSSQALRKYEQNLIIQRKRRQRMEKMLRQLETIIDAHS